MNNTRLHLLGLSRGYKRIIQVSVDVLLVWAALWLAFVVRLGIMEMYNPFVVHTWLFAVAPIVAIPFFVRFGMYRAVMRYFGNEALIAIIKAVTLSSLVLVVCVYLYSNHQVVVPRSIIFNYWLISMVLIGGLRLMLRHYFMGDWFAAVKHVPFASPPDLLTKVAIYGAGVAGNQLVAALRMGGTLRPVAFIDDDPNIADRNVAGLLVYGPHKIHRLIEETGAKEILLAIPSTKRARRREILEMLESYPLHVRSIPNFTDLASGRVKVQDIQEVDIADLLGRDAVSVQPELLERCITNRSVLVTGAGGSIGSELCRQIIELGPINLVLFEHSEFNLYNILSELEASIVTRSLSIHLIPILGTVRDQKKLLEVMSSWKIDTVYHAAAYKHVPIVEHNVAEGVVNNVIGTINTAQAALQANVANFVLISTDKAVRPTNVMGCTKRLAEMALQALSHEMAPVLFGDPGNVSRVNKTQFTMVRFGNVLGSSGSVIPLFYKQIMSGGPVTVTHPKITRYFMTIPEAAQLVIQAGSMGKGGDVFVLDMGEPVKIAQLAEKIVHLSGLSVQSEANPSGDIEIKYTGLRPGEKLYEELLIGDRVTPTRHPMIMCANEDYLQWEQLKISISELVAACRDGDCVNVRKVLSETVSGYVPGPEIVDWLYVQNGANAQDKR